MPELTDISGAAIFVYVAGIFAACKNSAHIPFPAGEGQYASPFTVPLQFGLPGKLTCPEKAAGLISVQGKFNFNNLPVVHFESPAFQTFPKPRLTCYSRLTGITSSFILTCYTRVHRIRIDTIIFLKVLIRNGVKKQRRN